MNGQKITQPEALRLASQLEKYWAGELSGNRERKAAAELRRLHEENDALKRCLFQMQEAAKSQGLTAAKTRGETTLHRLNKAAEDNGEPL